MGIEVMGFAAEHPAYIHFGKLYPELSPFDSRSSFRKWRWCCLLWSQQVTQKGKQ
jgi:hypothetical protein